MTATGKWSNVPKLLMLTAAGLLLTVGPARGVGPVGSGSSATASPPLPLLSPAGRSPIAPTGVYAVDMAVPAGIAETTKSWAGSAYDYDLDGCTDLLINRHTLTPRLYHNNCNGTFTEVVGAFPKNDHHEQTWGDLNGDGLPDLYWATGGGAGHGVTTKELWIQRPDHTFVDSAATWDMVDPYGRGRGAAVLDVNRDGKLDLFVGNKSPRVDRMASPSRLYVNSGTKLVEDPTLGLTYELDVDGVQAVDYDGDGYQDLLITGEQPLLLHNDGGTGFTDVSRAVGLPLVSMSDAKMADLNGDGHPDLVLLASSGRAGVQVLLQVGGVFKLTWSMTLPTPQAVAIGDVDGDGFPDLYVQERSNRASDLDRMLVNNGSATAFTSVAIPQVMTGNGDYVWPLDYDHNGLMDFVVMNGAFPGAAGPIQLIAFFPNPPGGKPRPTFGGTPATATVAMAQVGASAADEPVSTDSVAGEDDEVFDSTAPVPAAPPTFGPLVAASVSSAGLLGNGPSSRSSVSAGGHFVAFDSAAGNLVPGDSNRAIDIFVRDTVGGSTVRASVSSSGAQANGPSGAPVISADGRYVAFYSSASNLVAGDTNHWIDVFRRDLQTGTTIMVSTGVGGAPANDESMSPAISADGRYIAFQSRASNLVVADANGHSDVFVRDVVAGTTTVVSVTRAGITGNEESIQPAISAVGHHVAFASRASDLVAGTDTNKRFDVFVRDLGSGVTSKVDVPLVASHQSSVDSLEPSISASGQYVSFSSASRELVTPPPTNSQLNVYVRDVLHATTVRASITAGGTSPKGFNINSHLSDDGLSVVFTSDAKSLVATDQDSFEDTYLRNLVTRTTYRLSTTATGAALNAHSRSPSASPDNQFVAWATPTRLLAGNTAGQLEIVVRDLGTGWMGAPVASR